MATRPWAKVITPALGSGTRCLTSRPNELKLTQHTRRNVSLKRGSQPMRGLASVAETPIGKFPDIPEYPPEVPVAELIHLSLRKLRGKDSGEIDRLFEACKSIGFFLLDVRDDKMGQEILELSDRLMSVGQQVLSLDMEEKMKYHVSKTSFDGFKSQGNIVIDGQGTKDRFESYGLAKDHIIGLTSVPSPPLIVQNMPTFQEFTKASHSLIIMILENLEIPLKLPARTLSDLHTIDKPAGDQLRMIKCPPQPFGDRRTSVVPHTDFGSVTLLFNRIGGLQILSPEHGAKWLHVRPIPGHIIVNLGDAMNKLTKGLMKSIYHRVTSPPGEQAHSTRYSLAYLARPINGTVMKGLAIGQHVSSEQAKKSESDGGANVTIEKWMENRSKLLKSESFQKELWDTLWKADQSREEPHSDESRL